MFSLETVLVQHPDGYQVINKTDFDPDLHLLYTTESLEVETPELSDAQESEGQKPSEKLSEQVKPPVNRSRKKA
jgi:hypothetical protein